MDLTLTFGLFLSRKEGAIPDRPITFLKRALSLQRASP